MSKGQLKTKLRFLALRRDYALWWAVCAFAAVMFPAFGCAVDTSEPYPEDFEQEEPTVVTVQSLDPSSTELPEGGGTEDGGPEGKNQTEETTTGVSTDEEEEPDPDPWKIPSLPGDPGGGDDDGSSAEDPP